MSNKHTQYYGQCAIPGAVGDDYYRNPDETLSGSAVIINGPPEDGRCNICQRHISDLEPYGGCGDPCTGDFADMKLVKQFRKGWYDSISVSWECRDCFQRADGKLDIEVEDRLRQEFSGESLMRLCEIIEKEL